MSDTNVVPLRPGTVTPASLLQNYAAKSEQFASVIMIAVDHDGQVICGWSRQNTTNLAHALMCGYETIKQQGIMEAGE